MIFRFKGYIANTGHGLVRIFEDRKIGVLGDHGLMVHKGDSVEDALEWMESQSKVVPKPLIEFGVSTQVWAPIEALIRAQAEVIRRERDCIIESICLTPAYGEPYDLADATDYDREPIIELQAVLDRTDQLLGSDYGSPCIYHWDGEDMPEESDVVPEPLREQQPETVQ